MAEAGPKSKSSGTNGAASNGMDDADLRAGIEAARQAQDLKKPAPKRRSAKPKAAKPASARGGKIPAPSKAPAKPAAHTKKPAKAAAKATPVSAFSPGTETPLGFSSGPWMPAKVSVNAFVAPISAASREWMRLVQDTPLEATKRAGDLSLAVLDFAGANTTAAYSAMRAMAGAGSVGEALDIQRAYAEDTLKTAKDQAAALREQSTEVLAQARAPFSPQTWFSWARP